MVEGATFMLSGRRGGRAGSASIGERGVVGEGSSDMVFVRGLFDLVCGVMKIVVVGMKNSLKQQHKKNYQEEVQIRCSNNEDPNKELFDKLQVMDVKGIFNYFEELHGTDWISMMKETAPIFHLRQS